MVSCERFGESAGGLEGDFLEHEDGDGGSDGEPEDDEGTGEAVVGEEVHVVAEKLFARVAEAEDERFDGVVGIHAGNHGEERRKEANLCGTFHHRCEQYGK